MRPLIEAREFFIGRTGGPLNDWACDCVVIKTGVPFKSNGLNVIRTHFVQRVK